MLKTNHVINETLNLNAQETLKWIEDNGVNLSSQVAEVKTGIITSKYVLQDGGMLEAVFYSNHKRSKLEKAINELQDTIETWKRYNDINHHLKYGDVSKEDLGELKNVRIILEKTQ